MSVSGISGCSTDNHSTSMNSEKDKGEKDNLGNIGKIMRTVEYTKVIKDYRSLKDNEHQSDELEETLLKIDKIIMNKKSNIVIDTRIGNYGNVEVRQLFRAKDKSLVGIIASDYEVEAIKVNQGKDNKWTKTTVLDNEKEELVEKLENENKHGFYVLLEPKLEKINQGKCLGEVSGKTYIICEDDYGREVLYVIGFYENKRYKNDWDINVLQFVSQDGSFQDNCSDVYNVENMFIFKDGNSDVNTEANRVIGMYKENELYKTIKKEFK